MTELTENQAKEIAATILIQLGGNKFIAMTGAKNFVHGENGSIHFKIGKNLSGANYVTIKYNGKDLYDMIFTKITHRNIKEVRKDGDIYNCDLQQIFTAITGLATRL